LANWWLGFRGGDETRGYGEKASEGTHGSHEILNRRWLQGRREMLVKVKSLIRPINLIR
jgi:hypothetical protein